MGAEQFYGAWRLVSFETRRSTGEVSQPLGPNPVGLIIWDKSGRFSAQLMHGDLPPDRTSGDAEVLRYVAYFGWFEVDDDRGVLTHHVDGALTPNMLGVDQERWFTFTDARLELRPPSFEQEGVTSESVLTWERS